MFPFPKMKPFRGFMKLVFWGCKCLSDCCWWWCSCLVCLVVLCQALFQLVWLFRYMFLFFEAMFLSNSVLTPYAWNHLQPQSTRVETQRFLCIFNLGFIVACSWQHVEYCCRSGQHGFKQHRRKQDESRPWPCSSWAYTDDDFYLHGHGYLWVGEAKIPLPNHHLDDQLDSL